MAGGEEVLPVFWEDNYFSMLPGEERLLLELAFELEQLRPWPRLAPAAG